VLDVRHLSCAHRGILAAGLDALSRRRDQGETSFAGRLWIDFTIDQPESVAVAIPSIARNLEHDGTAREKLRVQHFPHRLAFRNMGIGIDNTVHYSPPDGFRC